MYVHKLVCSAPPAPLQQSRTASSQSMLLYVLGGITKIVAKRLKKKVRQNHVPAATK